MLTTLLWESLKLLPLHLSSPLLFSNRTRRLYFSFSFTARRGLSDQYDQCRSDICNFLITCHYDIFAIGLSHSLFSCWLGNSEGRTNFGRHLLRMVELSHLPCIAQLWTVMGKRYNSILFNTVFWIFLKLNTSI